MGRPPPGIPKARSRSPLRRNRDTPRFAGTDTQGSEANLSKGTLAAVSGKMVKQVPESMKIRTPAAIMGVRGTEFVVQVDEPRN